MNTIAQQESFVKESLFQFITKNIPNADLNVIDEIVLSYVISVLEQASRDPCFDLDGFIEMMSAYVPDFAGIGSMEICTWVLELEAEISGREENDSLSTNDDSASSDKISLTLQSLNDMVPSINKTNRSHSNSESSGSSESNAETSQAQMEMDQCQILHEMFPNSCTMEIRHCLSIAHGDMERAAATLLARREQGQALTAPLHAAHHMRPAARHAACDDHELKNRIIERYSYVDKNSGTKEHKPLAPKNEPKKMVRYRDNKIVSLKGERYTEVPKSGVEEEHLKKPKKQHCP